MVEARSQKQQLSLAEAAEHLLEECRMVLPGMQALFGFQLVTVFNSGFAQKLSGFEQRLHLFAIALVAIAIAVIMAPAAYHRQIDPREVTARFIVISTRLLLASMPLLALGISLDFYLIAKVIVDGAGALLLAAALLLIFIALWFVLPQIGKGGRSGPR